MQTKSVDLAKAGFVFWPVGTGDSTTVILDQDLVMQIDLRHLSASDDSADPRWPIIDHLVESLENWRLERLAGIDRGVLRLAATEILFLSDVPPKVSIQEAIRLAERYGSAESPKFVNGVLDALYKRQESSTPLT